MVMALAALFILISPPAAILLFLARKTRRLRPWATISLLTTTALLALLYAATLVRSLLIVKDENRLILFIPVFSLILMAVIIQDCIRLVGLIGQPRQRKTFGFAVKPIEANGVCMRARE